MPLSSSNKYWLWGSAFFLVYYFCEFTLWGRNNLFVEDFFYLLPRDTPFPLLSIVSHILAATFYGWLFGLIARRIESIPAYKPAAPNIFTGKINLVRIFAVLIDILLIIDLLLFWYLANDPTPRSGDGSVGVAILLLFPLTIAFFLGMALLVAYYLSRWCYADKKRPLYDRVHFYFSCGALVIFAINYINRIMLELLFPILG